MTRVGVFRCIGVTLIVTFTLSACGLSYNQRAPEVLYSNSASTNKTLQVPPDLTDVSDGEQFVLPGTSGAVITRNTLLPQIQSARYLRNGETSWLEIAASPEALWPELLRFLRREGLTVLRTQPVNGVIETEWALAVSDSGGSVLKNLLSGDDKTVFQRLALRLERATPGTRLFSQVQRAGRETAEAAGANQLPWSTSANADRRNELETASALLQRLLVHLGVTEQRAKGILDDASAAAIYDTATLERTAGGTQLLLHSGYRQSFRSLSSSLSQLGLRIESSDLNVGEIRAADLREGNGFVYTFKLDPVHVSAVKVAVSDAFGEPLEPRQAETLLQQIRESLV